MPKDIIIIKICKNYINVVKEYYNYKCDASSIFEELIGSTYMSLDDEQWV